MTSSMSSSKAGSRNWVFMGLVDDHQAVPVQGNGEMTAGRPVVGGRQSKPGRSADFTQGMFLFDLDLWERF